MTLRLIPHIHRATHRIGLYIADCPGVDVTQGEAHILAHLAGEGDSTVAQLHRALAHRRSTLTSILDRLVARGFVTRESSERDRRTFVIRLTPAGTKAARKIYAHLEALERQVIARASAAQLKAFAEVINAVEKCAAAEAE